MKVYIVIYLNIYVYKYEYICVYELREKREVYIRRTNEVYSLLGMSEMQRVSVMFEGQYNEGFWERRLFREVSRGMSWSEGDPLRSIDTIWRGQVNNNARWICKWLFWWNPLRTPFWIHPFVLIFPTIFLGFIYSKKIL